MQALLRRLPQQGHPAQDTTLLYPRLAGAIHAPRNPPQVTVEQLDGRPGHLERSVRCNGEAAEGLYRLSVMADCVDAVVLAAVFELWFHAEGLEDVSNFPLGHTF